MNQLAHEGALSRQRWRARLRVRILTLLGVISLAAIVAQFTLIDRSLVSGFEELEAQQLGANDRAVRLNLDQFIAPLERSAARIAGNAQVTASGLAGVLRNEPLVDLAWLRANDRVGGQGVLTVPGVEDQTRQVATLPLATAARFNEAVPSGRSGSFWLAVPGGLLAVAHHPRPDGSHLALGRRFNQAEITALERLSNTVIEVVPASAQGLADTWNSTWAAELTGNARLRVIDGAVSTRHQICQSLGSASGLGAQPGLLCVGLRDSIYRRSQLASSEIRLVSLMALALLVGATWFFIDRLLLRRLERVTGVLAESGAQNTRMLERTLDHEQEQGDEIGLMSGGMLSLLSRLRRSQADLEQQEQNFRVLAESAGVAILVHVDGRIVYANPFAAELAGQPLDALIDSDLHALLAEDDREMVDAADAMNTSVEVTGIRADESTYWARMYQCSIRYHSEPARLVTLADTTELVQATKLLGYQATHDELTGLANRRKLIEQLEKALYESQTGRGRHAFLYLDLDQFKPVNDTCGHYAGDRFLSRLALTLHERLGPNELIARVGGDELGIITRDADEVSVRMIAAQMHDAVSSFRFVWNDQVFTVGVSIGAVLLEDVVGDVDQAMSIADTACYVAKEQGFNRLHFHTPGDADHAQRMNQQRWMRELKEAIAHDRFVLMKQGIHEIQGGHAHCNKSELLLKMQGENGQFVAPVDFIAAAERYRLMPMIDRWVLGRVTRHLEAQQGGDRQEHLFMNLSGQSLGDLEFRDELLDWARGHRALLPHLTIEVTETAVIANMDEACKLMERIRALGGSFALDDFGSGLCSFSYLQRMEVEYLKLDGQFVRTMDTSDKDRALVETLIQLSRQLGLRAIAEHVETAEVLKILQDQGVSFAQGYYLDRPVPIDGDVDRSVLEDALRDAVA